MKTVITAASLFTPTECIHEPVVIVEDGRITAVHSRAHAELPRSVEQFDFPGMVLAPGFIDIHIHGGAGHDVMEADINALAAIETSMAKHGVTGYLPTTVTAPDHRLLRALEHLGESIASVSEHRNRAVPLGIHLEGPFISHAKRGVHPPEDLMPPSPQKFDQFWETCGGAIRMMTIAPELPGAVETIRHARELGVISSIGHSNATYEEAENSIAGGASHATHTFNAMRPLDHREPGILGAVLANESLSADIIADGVHVAPAVVKMFLAAKGVERAILITDAISATGMPDGTYRLGTFDVEVKGDRCEYEGKLAGSVLTLDRAVRNVMSFAAWGLQQVVRMVTLNPATLLGISSQRGMLAPGRIADIVVLTPEGKVVETIIRGSRLSASAH
jgi:N-acetylglucosamine-6-phosphate deacetylase